MRPSSIRALLLTLALVVQTIAAGASIAHAAPGPAPQTVAHHCEHMQTPAPGAPADHAAPGHMCGSCMLCGGPPAAALEHRVIALISPRAVASVGFVAILEAPADSIQSRTHSARAPPRAA